MLLRYCYCVTGRATDFNSLAMEYAAEGRHKMAQTPLVQLRRKPVIRLDEPGFQKFSEFATESLLAVRRAMVALSPVIRSMKR